MKNLLKITLLFAVFVVSRANVCGQQTNNVTIEMEADFYNGNSSNFNGQNILSDTIVINVPNSINSDSGFTFTINAINDNNTTQYVDVYLNDVKLESNNFTKKYTYENNNIHIKSGDKIYLYLYLVKTYYISGIITYYKPKVKTGINENILTKEVQLYSYDNNVVLLNQNNPKNLTVDIYTLTGQLVKTEQINDLYDKFYLETNLPSGIYVVRVSDGINAIVKKLNLIRK